MDTPLSIPHSAVEYALYSLVGLLAAGASYLFGRRQSNANAEKTKAETRQINAEAVNAETETLQTQAQVMVAMIKEAGVQALRAERLRDERDHWERKAGELQNELDLANYNLNMRISVNPDLPTLTGEK